MLSGIIRAYWRLKFGWFKWRLYKCKEIPSGSYLELFSRVSVPLPSGTFRLIFFEADYNEYSQVSGSIYHDAPMNILLWSMDEGPLAIIGFDIDRDGSLQVALASDDEDTVYRDPSYLIRQIQGVRDCLSGLRAVRWEKLLIQAVVDWAKSHKVRYVHVVKAIKNKWRGSLSEAGAARLHMHYDVTAKRMKFTPSKYKYTLAVW